MQNVSEIVIPFYDVFIGVMYYILFCTVLVIFVYIKRRRCIFSLLCLIQTTLQFHLSSVFNVRHQLKHYYIRTENMEVSCQIVSWF